MGGQKINLFLINRLEMELEDRRCWSKSQILRNEIFVAGTEHLSSYGYLGIYQLSADLSFHMHSVLTKTWI